MRIGKKEARKLGMKEVVKEGNSPRPSLKNAEHIINNSPKISPKKYIYGPASCLI
jgi:hypothetical protein